MPEVQPANPETTLASFDHVEDGNHQRFDTLCPYDYQLSIYKRIKQNWREEETSGRNFGNIVYLETGTGKTYIAVMLLKHLFNDKVKRAD